eukprot:2359998-Pyramimonas_sp.AAC.1
MMFADNLVLPGRLYNSGAWTMLTTAVAKMADAEVMKVYRAAAKVRCVEAESCIIDGQVLARLRRPPPDVLRRAARLRLLGSLLHTGPQLAFALLRAEWCDTTRNGCRARSWLGMVMDACSRLRATA